MATAMDVGMLVDGKYQIIDALGKGGMANVWLARDERLGKLWAIKEIKPNARGTRGEVLRQALIDEANFMKRLDHPAIPRIVDIVDTGQTVFVVMDYVEGRALSELLRERKRPFDQDVVINWGIQLCDVLGYLHGRTPAIVYRDMKPANVIMREDLTLRLIDFGIAMELADGPSQFDKAVGTPGYAPPEQLPISSDAVVDVSARVRVTTISDIYALGATLYTLVTGHTPKRAKQGAKGPAVFFDMRPIREWNPGLSEGLERIILRATRTNPADRYQRVHEMRYDLEHYEELTHEWRSLQRTKIVGFRRRLYATGFSACAAAACFVGSNVAREASYAELVHAAEGASFVAEAGFASEAEQLLTEAMALEPSSIEPYEKLLEVYESDYRLTQDEAERWQRLFARERTLADSSHYAQLCFDAGVCHLTYFGIDAHGGAVGNVGVESVSMSAPWFRRVIAACDEDSQQVIDEADLRSARLYATIADFYEQVTRLGKEGRTATSSYQDLWNALQSALERENQAADSERSAEGVRMRLCQVGVEALSSPTYLAGFSRSGIDEAKARDLLLGVRTCWEGLSGFVQADEYAEVYGPMAQEIRDGLSLADRNIASVYDNPVLALGSTRDEELT